MIFSAKSVPKPKKNGKELDVDEKSENLSQ